MGKVKRKRLDVCSSSRLKECLSGGHPPEDGEDRISWLPDGILLLILSFLALKETVQTSLLSRRWLYLWKHTQVLHFDAPERKYFPFDEECRNFVNRVNHVLKLHRSKSLNEFSVTFLLTECYKKTISNWLEYALARKVESLELILLLQGRVPRFFSDAYDFDGFLKLNSEKAANVANPDRHLHFRSLKSLSLKGVKVTGEAIDFILQNCPFLERLEVVYSQKLEKLVISGPGLVLKYLKINYCDQLKLVSISNIYLVSLNITFNRVTRGVLLTNLPMLVELSIYALMSGVDFRNVFSQSSSCLSQLESLTITSSHLQIIAQLIWIARLTKRLALKIGAGPNESLIELVSFIHACPYIEEFVLTLTRLKFDLVMSSRTVAQPEICSLKCLKVLKFVGYYGRVADFELVMHIQENSAALKKIIIDPCNPFNYSGRTVEEEEESRSTAHQQFEGLRESIQPRVIIL